MSWWNLKVVTSAVFACVGTAGQRCTTLRRLIVHEDLYDEVCVSLLWCLHIVSVASHMFVFFITCFHCQKVLEKLKKSYASIMGRLGDPLDDGTLYGPLHSKVRYLKAFCQQLPPLSSNLWLRSVSIVISKPLRTPRLQEEILSLEETSLIGCWNSKTIFTTPSFREGNYVEPTIVTGLPHNAPVVHR